MNRMFYGKRAAARVLISSIFLSSNFLFAQNNSQVLPKDVKEIESIRSLVVEKTYLFKVAKLAPAIDLTLQGLRSEAIASDFPFRALQKQYLSMREGNYEQFLNTWTPESRVLMEARNAKENRSKDFWIKLWKQNLTGISLKVKTVITYRHFVMLEYCLVSEGKVETVCDTAAFVSKSEGWQMTQELASEPVLMNWNHPSGRVQVPPDSLIPK